MRTPRRVIHRDLKPANVLLGKYDETVVIDWGLAKSLDAPDDDDGDAAPLSASSPDLTAYGTVLGTPAYMAPEQAKGDRVDERSDVYALGALLYHVLSGRTPDDSPSTVPERALRPPVDPTAPTASSGAPTTEIRPPRLFTLAVADIPRDLAQIVDKATRGNPAERYANASELAADLSRFSTGQLLAGRRYTMRELVRRWARKHRAILTVGALGMVMALALGGIALHMRRAAAEQIRQAQALAGDLMRFDSILRTSAFLPLHDVRRERRVAQERLRAIEALVPTASPAARGPIEYVLGPPIRIAV